MHDIFRSCGLLDRRTLLLGAGAAAGALALPPRAARAVVQLDVTQGIGCTVAPPAIRKSRAT
jgi:hypothetical protein